MENSNFVFKYPPPPPLPVYQPPPPPPPPVSSPSIKQPIVTPPPPPPLCSGASWSTNFDFSCPPPTFCNAISRNEHNIYSQGFKFQGNNSHYRFNMDKSNYADYSAEYIRQYYNQNRFRPPNIPNCNVGWSARPYFRKFRPDSGSDQRNENNGHGENGGFNNRFKKRKRPIAKAAPVRRNWTEQDAERAIEIERELSKKFKSHSLKIQFPDQELNREIVSNFNSSIETVYFQQPSNPRFCYVTLAEGADPVVVMEKLNKIKFGLGFLSVEYKKEREDEQNMGPEAIDPLTLYVGNLAQEVTKEDMVKKFPKNRRIDIGFAKRMKFTRYAFVNFNNVDDAIEAFKATHYANLHSKSLIVRFRRLHGTVGMPGEPKIQNQRKDGNSGETRHVLYLETDESRDQRMSKEVARLTINSPTPNRSKRVCTNYLNSSFETETTSIKTEPYDYPYDDEEYQWENDEIYFMDGNQNSIDEDENGVTSLINSRKKSGFQPIQPITDFHTSQGGQDGLFRDLFNRSNECVSGASTQSQSVDESMKKVSRIESDTTQMVEGSLKNALEVERDTSARDRPVDDSSSKIPYGGEVPPQPSRSIPFGGNKENESETSISNQLICPMILPKQELIDEDELTCSDDPQKNNDSLQHGPYYEMNNGLKKPKKEIESDSSDSDSDDEGEYCNTSTDFRPVLDKLRQRCNYIP